MDDGMTMNKFFAGLHMLAIIVGFYLVSYAMRTETWHMFADYMACVIWTMANSAGIMYQFGVFEDS